jgi:hypothetical protein
MIRHYQTRADALDDVDPSDRNHLHISHTANRWIIDADVDELAGVTIATAIDAATDKPSEGDTRSPAKRRSDAMVRICRFFLDHAQLSIEGGEAPHVSVVVQWDGTREGISAMQPDLAITRADISRLLCESNLSRMIVGPDSIPLDVGRATRHPSKALRRALSVRDRGCRFPGCDETELVSQPSRRPVAPRRRNETRQPRALVQLPPSPRPQTGVARHVRRHDVFRDESREPIASVTRRLHPLKAYYSVM